MVQDERPGPPSRRGALIAILVVLALAVAGWWVSNRLHQSNALQDCVMQGRHNCAPID